MVLSSLIFRLSVLAALSPANGGKTRFDGVCVKMHLDAGVISVLKQLLQSKGRSPNVSHALNLDVT